MKAFKGLSKRLIKVLLLITVISFGVLSTVASANDQSTTRPALKQSSMVKTVKAPRTDVAGFVIAARGSLTATNDAGETRTLNRRSKFYANEILKTGTSSRAQLRFKDRALMTLRPETQLDIGEYHFGGKKDKTNRAFLKLVSGGFRTISGAIGRANKSAYRINTPVASIGIRGTDYEIVISLNGKVFAAVHDGGITLTNDLGDLDLGADSNYLYAEVSAGEKPIGLADLPDLFVSVDSGQTQGLSEDEKKEIAEKIEELKSKAEFLLSDLGDIDVTNEGDIQQILNNERFLAEVDTRLSPEQFNELENANNLSVAVEAESGRSITGQSIDVNGNILFQTSEGAIFVVPENNIQFLDSGHENVTWGTWNKEIVLNSGGDSLETLLANQLDFLETEDRDFMSAQLLDVQSIMSRTDTVDLPLTMFEGGSTGDLLSIQSEDGNVTLDFNEQTANGNINFTLVDNDNVSSTGDVTINFTGNLLNGSEQNTDYSATVTGTYDGEQLENTDNVTVTAGVVEPGNDGDAFAGTFDVSTDIEGIRLGVFGQFLFANGISPNDASRYSMIPLTRTPF